MQEVRTKIDNRNAFCDMVLGTNGTGKTTTVEKPYIAAELLNGGNVLIVVRDDYEYPQVPVINIAQLPKLKGCAKIIAYKEFPNDFANIYDKKIFNGLIVFNDFRCYLKANVQEHIEAMLGRRRQWSLDILCSGHGFSRVPPAFFPYTQRYILFETLDNVKTRKNEIADNLYEKLKVAQLSVNTTAEKNKHYYEIID